MEEKYEFIKEILERDPFIQYVGIKVLEIGEGYAKVSMDFRREITRYGNIVNGGAIATLADTAGGTSVLSLMTGKNQVTVNLNINYLNAIDNGPVIAEGRVIRKGQHIVFSSIEIYDGKGKLCAHATGSWFLKDF